MSLTRKQTKLWAKINDFPGCLSITYLADSLPTKKVHQQIKTIIIIGPHAVDWGSSCSFFFNNEAFKEWMVLGGDFVSFYLVNVFIY